MKPHQAAEEIATRVMAAGNVTAAGLRAAYPRMPGSLPKTPALICLGMQPFDVTYQMATEQLWLYTVKAILVAPLVNETFRDVTLVDPLIVEIVDAFSPDNANRNFRLGNQVDYCQPKRGNAMEEAYGIGGHLFYGINVDFDIKQRRFAGDE
jgi:hypothetical protein